MKEKGLIYQRARERRPTDRPTDLSIYRAKFKHLPRTIDTNVPPVAEKHVESRSLRRRRLASAMVAAHLPDFTRE